MSGGANASSDKQNGPNLAPEAPAIVSAGSGGPGSMASSADVAASAAGRRRRGGSGREHAVFVRLSGEELAVLRVAAAAKGLTVTSFVATQALAVARGMVHPLPSAVSEVLRELVEARRQLTRYGVLLNQAVARLHVTGEVDAGLLLAAERCDQTAAALRSATQRLAGGS